MSRISRKMQVAGFWTKLNFAVFHKMSSFIVKELFILFIIPFFGEKIKEYLCKITGFSWKNIVVLCFFDKIFSCSCICGEKVEKCREEAMVRLKNHSSNLHALLCGIFRLHSVAVARYAAIIQTKSPTNCDLHLTESIFQTRSSSFLFVYLILPWSTWWLNYRESSLNFRKEKVNDLKEWEEQVDLSEFKIKKMNWLIIDKNYL